MIVRNQLSRNKGVGYTPNPQMKSAAIPDLAMTVGEMLNKMRLGQNVQSAMGVRYTIPEGMTDDEAFATYSIDQPVDELTAYDDYAAEYSRYTKDRRLKQEAIDSIAARSVEKPL